MIHVNLWQKPLQYCKVISLQLIKISGKKKEWFICSCDYFKIFFQHHKLCSKWKPEFIPHYTTNYTLSLGQALWGPLNPHARLSWYILQPSFQFLGGAHFFPGSRSHWFRRKHMTQARTMRMESKIWKSSLLTLRRMFLELLLGFSSHGGRLF